MSCPPQNSGSRAFRQVRGQGCERVGATLSRSLETALLRAQPACFCPEACARTCSPLHAHRPGRSLPECSAGCPRSAPPDGPGLSARGHRSADPCLPRQRFLLPPSAVPNDVQVWNVLGSAQFSGFVLLPPLVETTSPHPRPNTVSSPLGFPPLGSLPCLRVRPSHSLAQGGIVVPAL